MEFHYDLTRRRGPVDQRIETITLYDLVLPLSEAALSTDGFNEEDIAHYLNKLARGEVASYFGASDSGQRSIAECIRKRAQDVGRAAHLKHHSNLELLCSDGIVRFKVVEKDRTSQLYQIGASPSITLHLGTRHPTLVVPLSHAQMDRFMDAVREDKDANEILKPGQIFLHRYRKYITAVSINL